MAAACLLLQESESARVSARLIRADRQHCLHKSVQALTRNTPVHLSEHKLCVLLLAATLPTSSLMQVRLKCDVRLELASKGSRFDFRFAGSSFRLC